MDVIAGNIYKADLKQIVLTKVLQDRKTFQNKSLDMTEVKPKKLFFSMIHNHELVFTEN